MSSQIFASVQDVLNCGLAGSTCGHFKDYSCVAQWPLHKHCTNLHSCQPPQLVKTVCPFPLHSLLVTVIGVCVGGRGGCVCACTLHACACVLASLMGCKWYFAVLSCFAEFKYCLSPPSPEPTSCPFPHSQKNNPTSLYEKKKSQSRQVNRRKLMSQVMNLNDHPYLPESFVYTCPVFFM